MYINKFELQTLKKQKQFKISKGTNSKHKAKIMKFPSLSTKNCTSHKNT